MCNVGYVRGRCLHFPQDAKADAARFSFAHKPPQLVYILEKDHAPLEHGLVDVSVNEVLQAQAKAFLASHARLSVK